MKVVGRRLLGTSCQSKLAAIMQGYFEDKTTVSTVGDASETDAYDRAFVAKQTTAVQSVLKNAGAAMDAAVELLVAARGKIVVTGIGKSGHVGMKIASTMTSLGATAVFLHPAEAFHGDLGLVGAEDAVIMLSHSGETKETLRLLQHVKRHGAAVIAITGNDASSIASACDASLTYEVEDEGSPFNLAPMASTVAMLVIGDLLAARLCRARGFTAQDFAASHPGGSLGLQLSRVSELMKTGEAVPLVAADATFLEALKEMNAKKLGIVGVTDAERRLIGVVSDGDVRRFVSSERFLLEAPVSAAMTPRPKVIGAEDSLKNALTLMETHKIFVLFALDNAGAPCGVIHMHHIVEGKLL